MSGDVSALTLLVLRVGFLILLWFFVFAIVYALRSDLFGHRVRRLSEPAAAPTVLPVPAARPADDRPTESVALPTATRGAGDYATTANTGHLVITSGPSAGATIDLGTEPLTIGRAVDCGLVIRDDYTSSHHARLMLWNDEWMLQDLDSTNGTSLDGERVTIPCQVRLGQTIKVGITTFELRG